MAFSQMIGLAGNLFGAVSASNQAAQDRALRERMFNRQMELQELNFARMEDADRYQREENEYQRQMEQLNRLLMQQERQYQLDTVDENKAYAMEQRRLDIERQLAEDKEAAKIQQFNLQNLLQRQDISAQEREFAIQQLNEVKAIASGERDEDKRRFYEERAMAQMEREFLMDQFAEAKDQAYFERADQMRNRDMIMNQISGMQNALRDTSRDLGFMPRVDPISQADIDAEIDKRTTQYMGDVDRAADRVASVNEAELIRAGLDESTPGTARRGDIAARLANEYQQARLKAQDDAIRYITGESDALTGNIEDIMAQRSRILGETGNVYGAGIDQLMQTPQASSALGAYQMAQLVPSGIYSRNLLSASDFDAPIPIGTAAVQGSLTPGMADYSRPTSLASNQGFNVKTGIMAPYGMTLQDPSAYMSNAIGIGNNLYNAASSAYDMSQKRAYEAGSNFGTSFNKSINEWAATPGSWLGGMDDKANNWMGGKGWNVTPKGGWPSP
ncbi:MAG: hypothetical protein CL557_12445 [Alphaproteobacteria bacterium]|nr:hypothetical protein [Alphaproteobacteria bacterium]|tara:strand:- start:3269 stop:4774 length:1506 start_codon:yes stop_codon:yes gene_type:complete